MTYLILALLNSPVSLTELSQVGFGQFNQVFVANSTGSGDYNTAGLVVVVQVVSQVS